MSILFTLALSAMSASGVEFPGPNPGQAFGRLTENRLVLKNNVLAISWRLADGRLQLVEVEDQIAGRRIQPAASEAFRVVLSDGTSIPASRFRFADAPQLVRVAAQPDSVNRSDRFAGWQATASFESPDQTLGVRWRATLRDDANYAILAVTLSGKVDPVSVETVTLLDLEAIDAKVVGTVDGSPVVARNVFFACEHPLANNQIEDGHVICSSRCGMPLQPDTSWSRSAVVGVVPAGQLRRGFLYYVDRERARPYQLFLHYNSWWDIATGGKRMQETECLEAINLFGRELIEKRGVAIDSFVFDDGWDDPASLWQFHSGFPHGFEKLKQAAHKYDSAVGTWLSPWGGYGKAKTARLKYGKTQGFETNNRGFSLAGKKYYDRFRGACLEMIDEYGVNYFKFDGIARGVDSAGAGPEFAADIEALLRLTTELRQARPDVYLSITTGTWPSPYWLWYGDSVWRNGHDCGVYGVGSKRQQWITYRDMIVRRMIVDRAPLYPLNSLMTVSVCFARLGLVTRLGVDAPTSPDVDELADEIRMAFGSGTQLMELYVTPQLMPPKAWDVLADCARWSRQNADILVDTHWVGGDPGNGEPYGYASWSPRKGILVLRNPSDTARSIVLDMKTALELPGDAARSYRITTRWATQDRQVKLDLAPDQQHRFDLKPFEVRVFEAVAQ